MKLTIDRLGHHGDGLAQTPQGTIFVRRALPGEDVEGEVQGDRMAAPRILTPSGDRVAAPCRHAGACGGCAVQHLSDPAAAAWKVETLRRALVAQGLDCPVEGPDTSPPQSRRRATFAGRRSKSGVMIGFHAAGSDQIVETPDCLLVHPALLAVRPALQALTRAGASRKDRLALTVTAVDQGIDLAISGGTAPDGPEPARIADTAGLIRLTWNGETLAQAAPPTVSFDGITVPLPPGAFLQATPQGEAALRRAVTEATAGARHIADLFAGCGTFALPLARQARVHAVESDPAATQALTAGWRHAAGLKPVTNETRDLFRRPLLPDELARFDAVVLDPPRAGAAAQCAELARAQVPRIAMISCNPVTFARDAATLIAGGYRLDSVRVIDQFRWSTHLELAARFTASHMPLQ